MERCNKEHTALEKKIETAAPSFSYTHEQLNSLAMGIGFKPAKKKILYARILI